MNTPHLPTPVYLNKAKYTFRLVLYSFLFSILAVVLGSPFDNDFKNLLVAIPFLLGIVATPVGLYFNLRSFAKREPFRRQKLLYLSGYVFFMVIFLSLLTAVVLDFRSLIL